MTGSRHSADPFVAPAVEASSHALDGAAFIEPSLPAALASIRDVVDRLLCLS
jgi:hypothetical protein